METRDTKEPPPTKNKVKSGGANKFRYGKFEYHVCFQIDDENTEWKDDVVVLRTSDNSAYEMEIAMDDSEWAEKKSIEGVDFVIVRFPGVQPHKNYDCFVMANSQANNLSNPSYYLFRDRYLEVQEGGDECELDTTD